MRAFLQFRENCYHATRNNQYFLFFSRGSESQESVRWNLSTAFVLKFSSKPNNADSHIHRKNQRFHHNIRWDLFQVKIVNLCLRSVELDFGLILLIYFLSFGLKYRWLIESDCNGKMNSIFISIFGLGKVEFQNSKKEIVWMPKQKFIQFLDFPNRLDRFRLFEFFAVFGTFRMFQSKMSIWKRHFDTSRFSHLFLL